MNADQIPPIAIIGMSMKLPGDIKSSQALWDILKNAQCLTGKIRVQNAHFMNEDPRAFDAPFFSMSPAEACILDPQQRGLLEGAFHTFENAGYPIDKIAGTNTSVFCASFGRDNEAIVSRDPEFQSRYQGTSSGSTMLSNRVSYFYDLHGPSITVDTACSSGLYALHLGCQSVLSGESDMSLICGANVYMTPECMSIPLSNAGFLGPDGRSYSFDHRANGYGRGEGFAFILIKLLHNAARDGDVIRAVIRATGVNQDGRTPSITQPNSKAQVDLIRRTYQAGGLDLAHTEYVEAHGTGTPVGDPIEASGIGAVFRQHRTRPVHIGSIKSNIGHLEGASGIAAILKTVLILENGVIPPNANFEKLNPEIDAAALNIKVPTSPVAWPSSGLRRASVSSFGYGGSNAHAVLEDAQNYLRLRNLKGYHLLPDFRSTAHRTVSNGLISGEPNDIDSSINLNGSSRNRTQVSRAVLVLSSFDEDGIRRLAESLEQHLALFPSRVQTKEDLNNLAHTLLTRRSVFNWRGFTIVDLANGVLSKLAEGLSIPNLTLSSKNSLLNFVFTGQGSQYARMGLDLIQYPVFEQSVLKSDRHLSSIGCSWSVLEELEFSESRSRVHSPAVSQALCTIIQVALVDQLRAWNVTPTAVCGHSSGEIAAAYCAGAITRESAWSIAYFRGVVAERLSSDPKLGPTRMMSVGMSLEDVQPYLKGYQVCVACVNSPQSVTLSGAQESIDKLWRRLEDQEVFAKKLPVPIGYHSDVMQAGAAIYQYYISGHIAKPCQGEAPWNHTMDFFSSVTGTRIELEELRNHGYWVRNLLSRVQFCQALQAMSQSGDVKKQGIRIVVEVGPDAGLRRPIQDTLNQCLPPKSWKYVATMKKSAQDVSILLNLVGELWSVGIIVDVNKANQDSTDAEGTPKPFVDLPSYAFNHTKLFWEESRISKQYSFRPFRRQALFGIRDKDWNPAEPTWKNRIRAEESPWILEHGLNGSPLYPGAGMIVMAIEAVRQLATHASHRIKGYRLKNIHFQKAITLDKSDRGVETRIQMRPRKQVTNNPIQDRYDWRVYAIANDEWTECAYGSIELELDSNVEKERTTTKAARFARFSEKIKEEYRQDAEMCVLGVHHTQFYDNIQKHSGYDYGNAFRQLRDIKYDRSGHASASLSLRNYLNTMQLASEDPCVIHPTAFDAIFQAQMVALSQGGWQPIPTMMFTHLKSLWVSHSIFTAPGNPKVAIASHETMRTFREVECRTVAIFDDSLEPVLVSSGQRGTAITSLAKSLSFIGKSVGQMSYGIDYKPDLSLLRPGEIQAYMESVFRKDGIRPPLKENIDRADAMALHFVELVLEKLDEAGVTKFEGHLEKYVTWMRWVTANRQKWTLESRGRSDIKIEDVIANADREPSQRLGKTVGTNLYEILTGKKTPLEIIFEGGLVEDFYHSDMFSQNDTKVGAYMRFLAHANPHMRILELGAGTGSSTAQILPSLICNIGNSQQTVLFAEYAYTDISPSFFSKAQERFSTISEKMRFQKLDLELDPVSQGFDEGSYDVIIAGNVLHATSNMLHTLSRVKTLLRPGGKLIMGETTNLDNLRDKFVFGLLPGWWLQKEKCWTTDEEYRNQGPLLTEEQWAEVLPMAGFSGIEMVFRDHDHKPYHRVSIIVSSSIENLTLSPPAGPFTIIIDTRSSLQQSIADMVKLSTLQDLEPDKHPVIIDIQDTLSYNFHRTKVISLLELDQVLLLGANESTFSAVKKISLDSEFVLWVTSGGCPPSTIPASEIATGFGRTVCSEREDQGFITLSLQEPAQRMSEAARHIVRVLESLISRSPIKYKESEYMELDNVINIPRVLPQVGLNQIIYSHSTGHHGFKMYTVGGRHPKPHISLKIDTPGLLDTLVYEEDALGEDPPGEGFVEIEVHSTSMNFKDVVIALGQVPGRSFGFDGAGIISRTGPGSDFQIGDPVLYCYASGGGFGTFIKCPELLVSKIPNNLPFDIAAAIPAVYCTVVYAFDYVAPLKNEDTVLIHAGAGGVGQTAIQLAKMKGVSDIFVTVGSDLKRKLVMDKFGIPEDHIFYSRDTTFAEDILAATSGRGVDVVMNTLGGELLQQSLECTAPLGRFIDISKADILADSMLSMSVFDRGISFSAIDMVVVQDTNLSLMGKILEDVVKLFKAHPELEVPSPLHVYHPGELEGAMRYLQSGKNMGKVVVSYASQGDEMKYRPATRPSYHFSDSATYVVGGGLGGLGREIIRWMYTRGAKHFIILGKSGIAKAGAAKFIQELELGGARVWAPACDLSDRNLLQSILNEATTKMPPIKGCIQAAMVLHDSTVEKMSAESLHEVLRPKVTGSWNLHELLPGTLEFFVLLSSFCGIMGNRGQSNYAAGNTYQDALARHRASMGLKGVSIDLALVGEAGWAHQNHELTAKSFRVGHGGIKQSELMTLLDAVCDPSYNCGAQVVNIIDTPESLYRLAKADVLPWMKKPLFSGVMRIGENACSTIQGDSDHSNMNDDEDKVSYVDLVVAAASVEEASEIVAQGLVQKLSKSLCVAPESLDIEKAAYVLGVDSLIAVEVRYWFAKKLGVEVAVFNILKDRSLLSLSREVVLLLRQ
ncbi:KR domain-containing protein [Colletotrichum graminicola]|uniref:KR domain-containing protein n=1 Tax=Colletotrichum graminicola (strain M1.001 / M2 / FGSC 10212) TaxID=645133 RepID=E3R0Q1_COLGM|nr:KR domain-containing protein [Colletotrichum graminicola M1.001]EFQ36689.1 KR domain-containing protein [Colletotrichum graminicola M1.001]WDK14858.1 KR domain-containing protein [Colletotrichum graminicola]